MRQKEINNSSVQQQLNKRRKNIRKWWHKQNILTKNYKSELRKYYLHRKSDRVLKYLDAQYINIDLRYENKL